MEYDLVFTGVQADDDNCGIVGIMQADQLGLPHAAVTNRIEIGDGEMTIWAELEGGVDEVSRMKLPALLTIQTGLNEPRYVSIMGIRRAAKKEFKVITLEDLFRVVDALKERLSG